MNQSEENKTLPWIEKYRPTSLSDVVAHPDIIHTGTFARHTVPFHF